MTLNLRLEYQTTYGEDLYVVVGSTREKCYPMTFVGGGIWEVELKLTSATELVYRYEVRRGDDVVRKEWGEKRCLALDKKIGSVRVLELAACTAKAQISAHATISPDPAEVRSYDEPVTFTVTAHNGVNKTEYVVAKGLPEKIEKGFNANTVEQQIGRASCRERV